MRQSTFFVLVVALVPGLSVLACSSPTAIKKTADAATDPVAIADRATDSGPTKDGADAAPTKDAASADAPSLKDTASAEGSTATDAAVTDSPSSKDATASEPLADTTAVKDGVADDLSAIVDVSATDIGGRDGSTVEVSRDSVGDVAPDVGPDTPLGCQGAPSVPPACNDDSISSAIQGVCQSDGTCRCNTGYALNPNTGRCGYQRWDAAVGG